MPACSREDKQVNEAVWEVLPTCCASCCVAKVALLVFLFSSVAHLFLFISVPFTTLSSSLIPSYLLHPLSCDFLSSFLLLSSFFFQSHRPRFPKKLLPVCLCMFVCSCCFTVSAPDSRFILLKTTEMTLVSNRFCCW